MRLEDVPREWLVAAAAALAVFVFWTWLRGWRKSARMRARFVRGAEGEREAAALLEGAGYVIEGAQVAGGYTIHVDGAAVSVSVRADYLVRRGRDRYVAEVKTGSVAPKPTHPATRRQLLEYRDAFAVDGVLLIDADARRIHRVELPRPRSSGFFARLFASE